MLIYNNNLEYTEFEILRRSTEGIDEQNLNLNGAPTGTNK